MVEPQSASNKGQQHSIINASSSRMNLGILPMASGSGRLESFRPPRDLSLNTPTVSKPQKRKFEPIIPSAKIKSKIKVQVPVKPSTSEGSKKKEYKDKKKKSGNNNFRGHGRARDSQYIQLQGVTFGEMEVLPIHRIKERYDSKIDVGAKKSKEFGAKPYFKEEELDQQHELEADDLIRSMKYYNIDEPKVRPKCGDAKPVVVPFRKLVKQEVKEEPEEVDEKKPFHLNNFQYSADTFIDLTALSISDILQQPSGSMFLLQMPDCLPGHVEAEVEPRPSSSQEPATTVPARRSVPCTLKDLGEGPLGSLEFMASGRVRLNFGNGRVMYLEAGTPAAVRQEVVSADIDPEARTGSMKVLGEVNGVAICSPDWDSELQHVSKHKS